MLREPTLYLAKIRQMCDYLLARSRNTSEAEYLANQDLRFAVERVFIIIGEAMSQLRTHFPKIGAELDQHLGAIGFRNLLVHRYWDVDDTEVWSIVVTEIAPLKAAVEQLLSDTPPSE